MNKKKNSVNGKVEWIAWHVKIALIIAIICFSIGLVTAVPQQDYTLYGTATLNGKVLTAQDDDVISLKVDGVELVSYTMGDISGTDNYVLKVPMDSDSSVATAAQEGDSAYMYINGVVINEGVQIIGAPAAVVKLDISATSESNPPSTPTLNDPGTTDTDGSYTVSWSSVSGATSYTLEEDTSSSFSSPSVVHSGAGTSKDITGKSDGTYYYRVKACNAGGCSGWSNVENIVVSPHTSVLATIKVLSSAATLYARDTQQFTATAYDQYDDVMSDILITWTSSNETVGTIRKGIFTAIYAGETTIVATNGTVSGTASVTVLNIQPEEEWNRTFGGTCDDWAHSVRQTTDGGYILTGSTLSYGAGSMDAWLVKTDSNGNEQWSKTFGGSGEDDARTVQQTTDGGYILAGSTNSYGAGSMDAWLVKIDSNGNEQWGKTFGGTDEDGAWAVQQTTDGGYILVGETRSHGAGSRDGWLVKTDSNGNEQWSKTFGGADFDSTCSVQQTTDGGYILAGITISYGAGSKDAWLVKTDSNGNEQWSKTFSGADFNSAESVQQTADGGYIFAGTTISYGAGLWDAWLVKTNSNGNKQWDRTFGGSDVDGAESVKQTVDGGYIIAGYTDSYVTGTCAGWLVKTESNGNEQWNMTFGRSGNNWAHSVQQTADGGYIIAASTDSYGAGSVDCWLIKVKGEEIISSFDTRQSENPYPSIPGTHTGTITPNQDITVQKLYTYPCAGTGGHAKSVWIYGNNVDKSASRIGYAEDWDTITFDSPFTLEAGKTYTYEIITSSYPQIHHTPALQTETCWINCTSFVDANGKEHKDWIPAIRLFS